METRVKKPRDIITRGIAYKKEMNLSKQSHPLARQWNWIQVTLDAYCNRGVVYYFKGEYERSLTDYNEAIELDPRHVVAYNNRGVAYSNKVSRKRLLEILQER